MPTKKLMYIPSYSSHKLNVKQSIVLHLIYVSFEYLVDEFHATDKIKSSLC